jgi:hypothetical protein
MDELPGGVAEPEEGSTIGRLKIMSARLHLHPRQGLIASGFGPLASGSRAQEKQAGEDDEVAMREGGHLHWGSWSGGKSRYGDLPASSRSKSRANVESISRGNSWLLVN